MRMSLPGRGGHRGFTLFELIVVLILLGLASAVVVPSFVGGFGSLQLETSARDLITHMKQARSDAVAQQLVRRVQFQFPEDLRAAHSYVLMDEFEQVLQSHSLPQGIRFPEDRLMSAQISFYPNGRSSGGTVSLVSDKGKTLTIDVDPITGFGKLRRSVED